MKGQGVVSVGGEVSKSLSHTVPYNFLDFLSLLYYTTERAREVCSTVNVERDANPLCIMLQKNPHFLNTSEVTMGYCPRCGQVVDFSFLHREDISRGVAWQLSLACLPDEERKILAEGIRKFLNTEGLPKRESEANKMRKALQQTWGGVWSSGGRG